jgi:hypothetical protein
MTLYELIDLSQNIGNRVDAQWGFFLTVHMALFGGIIYVDRPLRKAEKFVAIILYTGFALVNYFVLPNQLAMQQVIHNEISQLFGTDSSGLAAYFTERARGSVFEATHFYSKVVHVVMWVIVALSVIYDRKH